MKEAFTIHQVIPPTYGQPTQPTHTQELLELAAPRAGLHDRIDRYTEVSDSIIGPLYYPNVGQSSLLGLL